jgi:methionine-rich copper-binding protein CopC
MMHRHRYEVLTRSLLGTLLGLFLLSVPAVAFAQLNVVQISPADGSTNVPTQTDIVISFSAPLDTSARFGDDVFPVALMLFPDSLREELTDLSVSPDLKTLTFSNVQLEADARYVVAVVGAVSNTGDPLERPAASTFTTGSALPTGQVSGQVTFPGGDPQGALVGLFEPELFGDEGAYAVTVVTDPNGNYTIPYVPAGNYLPGALKDTDGDGEIDPVSGDAIALYDPNGDFIPDSISVAEGESVTGIDLVLSVPEPVTARGPFTAIDQLVKQRIADAGLVVVMGIELIEDGTSIFWVYQYYSATAEDWMAVAAFGPYLVPTTSFLEDVQADTTVLPDDWIDSDAAIDTANANGGADFLAENPDAEIFASLKVVDLEMGGQPLTKPGADAAAGVSAPKLFGRSVTGVRLQAGSSATAQQPTPLWFFIYSSDEESLFLGVHAVTGEFIPIPSPFAPASARDGFTMALAGALAWATDAQLVAVVSPLGDVSPSGESVTWVYVFYSTTKDSVYQFVIFGGVLVASEPTEAPFTTDPLPPTWVDSRMAVAAAETEAGAAYRQSNPNAFVSAALSRGILSGDPQRAIWAIIYHSFPTIDQGIADLGVLVDAETGQVIAVVTDVEEKAEGAPTTFSLSQNYPNPFNPETTIEFQLPVRSPARLVVTNLLGQTVAVLVDRELPAGVHRVTWDARDSRGEPLPSGVYFYRLEARDFVSVRKAILMR